VSDRIEFTRTSGILENKAMAFEVAVDGHTIIDLFTTDDKTWEITIRGKFSENEATLKWSEFLDIVHELHKFIATENEILLQRNENEED
jgi:hypothetical protein